MCVVILTLKLVSANIYSKTVSGGQTNGIAVALNALFSQHWGERLFTGLEIDQERRETHHY